MHFIFCALPVEGKAIIDHFRLSAVPKEPFDSYKNDTLTLVITGVGTINAAAAVAYTYGKYSSLIDSSTRFINYGTAGAKGLRVGSLFLAHTVAMQGHKKIFYPDNPPLDVKERTVITGESPVTEGEVNFLYDMEAYGFCQACDRFLLTHQYLVLKSVSDNLDDTFFDKKLIREIAESAIPFVTKLIETDDKLEILTKEEVGKIEDFFERAGFSFTQREALMPLFIHYKLSDNKVTIFLEKYANICVKNKQDRNKIFNYVRQSLIAA